MNCSRDSRTRFVPFRFQPKWILIAALVGLIPGSANAQSSELSQEEKAQGFVSLFNGSDLTGWSGDPRFWSVKEGAIIGQTSETNKAERNTFLVHDEQFSDFELRFSYQVENFNSGMQYRSEAIEKWFVKGYQADFEAKWHDEGKTDKFSGMFFEENGRMFMGQRGDVVVVRPQTEGTEGPTIEKIASVGKGEDLEKAIRRGDWNDYTIMAQGYQFTHIINGQVMSIGWDEDPENRKRAGVFALQLHSGPPMKIQVKNIRVRKIESKD